MSKRTSPRVGQIFVKLAAEYLSRTAQLAAIAGAFAGSACGDASSMQGDLVDEGVGTATEAFDPSPDPNSPKGHAQITMKALKILEARGMLPDALKGAANQALVVYGNNFGDRSSAGWPNGGIPTQPIMNRMSARVPDDKVLVHQHALGSFKFDAELNDFPWDDPELTVTGEATIGWVPGNVNDRSGDYLSDSMRLEGSIKVETDVILEGLLYGARCAFWGVTGVGECEPVEPDPSGQDLKFAVDNMYHYSHADLRDLGVPYVETDTGIRFYPFFKEHVPGYNGSHTAQDAAVKISDYLRGQALLTGSDYGALKYGSILYQVARRFFVKSAQPEPDLAQLIKVGNDVPGWHTGWMQGHGGFQALALDFPHTYLGGMPYVCNGPTADPCATGTPTWPGWIKASAPQTEADLQKLEEPRPGRSDRAGLIYLGWATHMMQDSAVPHHMAGWTGKEHAIQDTLAEKPYFYKDYTGMTVPKITCAIPASKLGPPSGCRVTGTQPHPYSYPYYNSQLIENAMATELNNLLGPVGQPKNRNEICRGLGVRSGDGSPSDLNWRAVYPLYLETGRKAYESRREKIVPYEAEAETAGLSYTKNAVYGTIKLLLCSVLDEENLALNKPSWQSSDLPGYGAVASRANDGNRDGNFWAGSVTHTNWGLVYPTQPHMAGQYWYVYLSPNNGPERRVSTINIYNRTDCCSERLSHYNVLAWNSADEEWQVISNHANDTTSPASVSLQVDALTRYIMISKTNDDYMSLAEVEVIGK